VAWGPNRYLGKVKLYSTTTQTQTSARRVSRCRAFLILEPDGPPRSHVTRTSLVDEHRADGCRIDQARRSCRTEGSSGVTALPWLLLMSNYPLFAADIKDLTELKRQNVINAELRAEIVALKARCISIESRLTAAGIA